MRTNGPEIRRRRQATGMKAAAFAKRLHCSVQHLHNIENGHKQASPELLHRIAKQLDVPVEVITLTGEQVPA